MDNLKTLFDLAIKARKNAHAPYSKFKVGAAILSAENHFYSGANVENVSYPLGNCAEASAIADMVKNGDKKIKEILVVSAGKHLITPCGGCLQRIEEFATPKTIIHLADLQGVKKSYKLQELLPIAFRE